MKTVEVQGSQGISYIYVGESIKNVSRYIPKNRKCVIITDTNVKKYYKQDFPQDCPVITISTGEEIKTLSTVETILRELIELGADRSTFILGIGGGIVCDITGFAASIYMRGLDFGFVSTTLLSQVDASVGGKNGVNFDSYKNMAGVFCQPEFVICDTLLLKTLPKDEISNGFAEIVKHALIFDADMLDYIEQNVKKALLLDDDVISKLVQESVKIKAAVVQKDEKEAGERKKLNFGHTIGHALEKLQPIGHGKAVSIGMAAAASFSEKKGLIGNKECERIKNILKSLDLPINITDFFNPDNTSSSSSSLYTSPSLTPLTLSPSLFSTDILIRDILHAATKDKKKDNNDISFIFLTGIGSCIVEKINFDTLEELLKTQFCL